MTVERIPKFAIGQDVKVIEPKRYIAAFALKVKDRRAIVEENIREYRWASGSNEKSFLGRVRVRFEKRNGRGKEFTEIMPERDLTEWTS